MSILTTRIAALIALFGLTFIVGILPSVIFSYLLKRKRKASFDIFSNGGKSINDNSATKLSTKGTIILQLLMFFGGGVLLSTCFLHLIPEVRESFDDYFEYNNKSIGFLNDSLPNGHDLEHSHDHDDDGHNHFDGDHNHNSTEINENSTIHDHDDHDHDNHSDHKHSHGHSHQHSIPYVELAICAGFFLVYFLEEMMHALFGHSHHHDSNHHHSHQHNDKIKKDEDENPNCDTSSTSSSSATPDEYKKRKFYDAETDLSKDKKGNLSTITSSTCLAKYRNHHTHQIDNGYDNYAVDYSGENIQTICNSVAINEAIPVNDKEEIKKYYDTNDEIIDYKLPALVRFLQGLVTIGAFSAHSIFDGVAIGLQETDSQIWTMLFAICVHKLVVAFVIGMELFQQTASVLITSIHILLFSLTSPIGILLVIFTESSLSGGHSPVLIFLSAIATGTILYIIFFEILKKDRCAKLHALFEFSAMLIGFLMMSAINLFIAH